MTSVLPSNVSLGSALAVFAPPSLVKTLLSSGFVIVVNPVPLVPAVPLVPLVPLEPDEPLAPLTIQKNLIR